MLQHRQTVDGPASASAVTSVLDTVARGPQEARGDLLLHHPAPSLVSRGRHTTYAAITLRAGDNDQKLADYLVIKPICAAGGDLCTQFGGVRPFSDNANAVNASDIARAMTLSLPLLL